jgi:hypothetical protein
MILATLAIPVPGRRYGFSPISGIAFRLSEHGRLGLDCVQQDSRLLSMVKGFDGWQGETRRG